MPKWIKTPTLIEAAGHPPKRIEEFFGHVNSSTPQLSVARMTSPEGWIEPGQTPEFDEYTLVLDGSLVVETRDERLVVHAGQAILTHAGEWVRYSSPFPGGAHYIAICLPAFHPDTVHRDT